MPKCKVDLETSPTFKRDVRQLAKKYRHIYSDLKTLRETIESNYSDNRANPSKLMMPRYPDLQGKVWKYDCKSADINKHQRESLRVVCMFLDDQQTTLYGVMCFVRPNNSYVDPKDVARCLVKLREAILNPRTDDDDSEDEYATTA